MKNSKIYLFSLGIILAFTANTLGQEKNYYRMERLKANNFRRGRQLAIRERQIQKCTGSQQFQPHELTHRIDFTIE